MKKIIIYLFALCLLSGCGGFGFFEKDHVLGNYYLQATDDDSQLNLSYCDPRDKGNCSGVIDNKVFAVGYNKEYIIAKQHPHDTMMDINRSVTNYFILPIKDGASPQNSDLIGPLTLKEFNANRKKLKISDLKFTIEKEKVLDNYYLVAVDADGHLALDYCEPTDTGNIVVINKKVFAAGNNKDYIIAKQHPNNTVNITNYFILATKGAAAPQYSTLIGPLTLEQFNAKRKELKISDLKFTIEEENFK